MSAAPTWVGWMKMPYSPRAICFECHRADRRREEAIKAAGEFEGSPEGIAVRFQDGLPFEPVDSHEGYKLLRVELTNALQFVGDDQCLVAICVQLGPQSDDFILKLGNPLGELGALAFACRAPRLE